MAVVGGVDESARRRVNICLTRNLLERIDAHAKRAGVNRSVFFIQAARAYMGVAQGHDQDAGQ